MAHSFICRVHYAASDWYSGKGGYRRRRRISHRLSLNYVDLDATSAEAVDATRVLGTLIN